MNDSVRGSIFSQDRMATYRSSTLIEVIISTCLYFLRSFYPNLGHNHLSPEEIKGNREVQLMSIDILSVLVSELILAVSFKIGKIDVLKVKGN